MHGITCYCPTGLLPHFYMRKGRMINERLVSVNALSGCYLISTLRKLSNPMINIIVSMPSRAVTSFLLR